MISSVASWRLNDVVNNAERKSTENWLPAKVNSFNAEEKYVGDNWSSRHDLQLFTWTLSKI